MAARTETCRSLAVAFGLAALLVAPSQAHADLRLDARWKQSALREDFTVRQWFPGCGSEPQSGTTGGGEVVTLRPEGDELTVVGGGRVYRTNQCYDTMPSLVRETHSRDPNGKTWRTRCTTPPNDPRRAILNTLVVATTDTHIDVIETGRYEVVLQNGTCTADVKRTRSYSVAPDEKPGAQASASPPSPSPIAKEPKISAACQNPGEPSRLEVRPSKKLMRTGESFRFRGVVLDDKGCGTRTPLSWALASGGENVGLSVAADGTVTVLSDAAEGVVEIVASAAGKSTHVSVEISQPSHYDDLLARSGLNAEGENDAASIVAIGSESIGAGEGRVEDRAEARRRTFLAIVGSSLLVLGAIAIVLVRRSRRAALLEREAEERHEARIQEVLERRKARQDEYDAQLREHEESVLAANREAEGASATPRKEKVCPSCGGTFAPAIDYCPHDGTQLVVATEAMAAIAPRRMAPHPAVTKRGKICPTCGDRFDGGADYCGKDGTQLVLLN